MDEDDVREMLAAMAEMATEYLPLVVATGDSEDTLTEEQLEVYQTKLRGGVGGFVERFTSKLLQRFNPISRSQFALAMEQDKELSNLLFATGVRNACFDEGKLQQLAP